MAKKAAKPKAHRPKKPTKARGDSLSAWRASYPEAFTALKVAQERFGGFQGVLGFGLGREYLQSYKRYTPIVEGQRNLCIRILTTAKRPLDEIPKDEILPEFLSVQRPDGNGERQFSIDVLQTNRMSLQDDDSEVHVWPTAQCINVGRIFSFGKQSAAPGGSQSGQFSFNSARLGTVGALIKRGTAYLAVSAGHVFATICDSQFSLPGDDCMVGVDGPNWVRLVNTGSFLPLSLEDGAVLNDVALMAVPKPLLPSIDTSWPPSFDRSQFCTQADIDAAIHSPNTEGFVWCERTTEVTGQAAIQIDLLTDLGSGCPLPACDNGGTLNYGPIWQYRYTGPRRTIGGDSGAPVFLRAAENPTVCRLLGFHVVHDAANNFGYAMHAETFLTAALNQQLNSGYKFA